MTIYAISMPITGFIYMEIEAENEEQAKELFYSRELTKDDIEDWDMHEQIIEGNVFHGILNEIIIEEA